MNTTAAYILGFFGAVFGALTLQQAWHVSGPAMLLPFGGFLALAIAAFCAGRGVPRVEFSLPARRALVFSTIGEVLAIMIGVQIAMRMGRSDLVLPVIALSVGLHFLPIGHWVPQSRFIILGISLIVLAVAGFLLPAPTNMAVAGIGGCLAEWAAAGSVIAALEARRRSMSGLR